MARKPTHFDDNGAVINVPFGKRVKSVSVSENGRGDQVLSVVLEDVPESWTTVLSASASNA